MAYDGDNMLYLRTFHGEAAVLKSLQQQYNSLPHNYTMQQPTSWICQLQNSSALKQF